MSCVPRQASMAPMTFSASCPWAPRAKWPKMLFRNSSLLAKGKQSVAA